MRFHLIIIGLFLMTSMAATKKSPESWLEAFDFSKMVGNSTTRSFIKDILEDLIHKLEGEKKLEFNKIEIDSENGFENVMLESVVSKINFDIDDKIRLINIKNLTAPIKLLKLNGDYNFQELILPGGLNIYGNGKFTVELDDLNVFLSLSLKHLTSSNSWVVNDMKVNASMKSFLFEFENLMNGEPMGDFINSMINGIVPVLVELLNGLVEENKNEVMKITSDLLNTILNLLLE